MRDRVVGCGNAARRAMLRLLTQRGARLERPERLLAAVADGGPPGRLHRPLPVRSGARAGEGGGG